MSDTEALLARWAERLRRDEPRAVAVLCHGSYARGEPEAHSDLDMDVLVEGAELDVYTSAFDELPDGRLLHVTVQTTSLRQWLEQFDEQPAESEEWAFFLPARQAARLLWATPKARRRLQGRVVLELRLTPQLQDLLESAAKVRNAAARGDELGARLAASDLAVRCPALLALAAPAPPPPAESRRDALRIALGLAPAPAGYRDDLIACLGLSGRATTLDEVCAAALRLAEGVLAALGGAPADRLADVEPGLPAALAGGGLLRLLRQP
jgi:phosphoribosyl-AMP cyclohydrolase